MSYLIPHRQVQFVRENLSHPVLRQLRQQEHLDEVIAAGANDWEKALLLRDWVRGQWEVGDPEPYPPWNALVILQWVREKGWRGFCGNYAQVFLQSLLSVGIQARYIEVGMKDNPRCHFLTEVWLPEYRKWAMCDASQSEERYALRNGIPMDGLEIHWAWYDDNWDGMEVISDPGTTVTPQDLAKSYYYYRIVFRQDQLSSPPENPTITYAFDSYSQTVEWTDDKTVPWEDSPFEHPVTPKVKTCALRSSNPAAFQWAP